ncbi:MAG: AI-2E family transporter [Candidatus Roizmanbacteria bacterium]
MRTIDVSTKTIIKIFLVPLAAYILWMYQDILFSIFIAFIIMSALRPAVNYLNHQKRIKRPLATAIVYLIFVFALSIVMGTIIPPIIKETTLFIENLPMTLAHMNPDILSAIRLQEISQYLPDVPKQLFSIISNIFSNTLFVVTSSVFGFYFLSDEFLIRNLIEDYIKPETMRKIENALLRTESRLASWFWGELTLMLAVGIASYIGFYLIGLKYALPLAVLAGLLEAVPNIGPTVAAVPATLIGFSVSPFFGFAALIWSIIVQQLENNFLVPYIMKKAVGIRPVVTMLCIFFGLRLAGPLGVLLAVPTYLCVQTLILDPHAHKKR